MKHNEAYRKGVDLITPHMRLAGRNPNLSAQALADLREGIRYLDMVLNVASNNWAAWWVRGKAEQALTNHESAYESFHSSYIINSQNRDVGRELVLECLETGRASEAVQVAEAICEREPKNAGLLANLALAYLIDGQVEKAMRSAEAALQSDTSDPITKCVKIRIADVQAGRLSQPSCLSDLS